MADLIHGSPVQRNENMGVPESIHAPSSRCLSGSSEFFADIR